MMIHRMLFGCSILIRKVQRSNEKLKIGIFTADNFMKIKNAIWIIVKKKWNELLPVESNVSTRMCPTVFMVHFHFIHTLRTKIECLVLHTTSDI